MRGRKVRGRKDEKDVYVIARSAATWQSRKIDIKQREVNSEEY